MMYLLKYFRTIMFRSALAHIGYIYYQFTCNLKTKSNVVLQKFACYLNMVKCNHLLLHLMQIND